jgi:hypothetical protein
MLAKMEGEVLIPKHVESPLKDQNVAAAAGQSAKLTPVLSQSAKPTTPVPTGMGVPELAKPTPTADTALESAELTPTVPMASELCCDDFASTIAAMVGIEVPKVPDEEMVDYEATPKRGEVNVVVLSANYYIIEDNSTVVVFNFPIQDATFKKPERPINHLKPLHVKGHINGTLVHNMLVNNGVIVNVMPYPLYKKLGGTDEELVRTNMVIIGVGGGVPITARGIANMELTIGSKTLAMTFFVADVQGSYSLILGRDWIHANCCIPSSMHQFLIQWVDDVVELVYSDSFAEVATADAPMLGGMMLLVACLVEIFLAMNLLVLLDKVVLFMYL